MTIVNKEDRIGQQVVTMEGELITLIDYKDYFNILVEFKDGITKQTNYRSFKNGSIKKVSSKDYSNLRVGETIENIDGDIVKIIKYINAKDVDFQFDNGEIVNGYYHTFKNKKIRKKEKFNKSNTLKKFTKRLSRKDKIGLTNINKDNIEMTIIDVINYKTIIVKFEDGFIKKAPYESFKKGSINNPYYKSIANFGYIGEGIYQARNGSKLTPQYSVWVALINRCYEPYTMNKHSSYINCEVCNEWENFQNFGRYYDENIYHIPNERIQIDKDILCNYLNIDNKIYSPDTCLFVPQTINNLFPNHERARGEEIIGVYYDGRTGQTLNDRYTTYISKFGKRIHLGSFRTEIEAFNVYKKAKEEYVKEIADLYKQYIPAILYKAMHAFEVKTTD